MRRNEYDRMFLLEDRHFWFLAKRFFVKTYLKEVKNNIKDVLDIGAGTGGMTKFMETYGKVTSIEKNPYAASLARKRKLKVLSGEAENLPFKSNSYDLVTLFDILYHQDVKSVDKALQEAHRVLKEGKFILITDSAFDFLKGFHSKSVGEARRFRLESLSKKVNKAGFRILKASYIYFSIFPWVFLKRFLLDKLIKQADSDVKEINIFINGFLLMTLQLESIILKFVNLPIGSSLIILAKSEKN